MTAIRFALVLAILVIAFALRARRLAIPTLTGDEWFMHRSAQEGAAWIIAQARVFEPHPLLYYLGIWAWEYIAGSTEFALRLPSACFGVLLVAGVWRLGYQLGGPSIAIPAALLAMANPYLIAQSQNARNYQMVAALATLATAALLIAARPATGQSGINRAGWTRYAALSVAALHTHLNAILTIGAHAIWLVAKVWRADRVSERPTGLSRSGFDGLIDRLSPAARPAIIIALSFVPWLLYAAPALLAYRGFYPEHVEPWDVAVRTASTFLFAEPTPREWQVAILVPLLIVGLISAAVGRGPHRAGSRMVILAAVVPVVATAILFLVRPMFEERYLIVAAPMFPILMAIGITTIGAGRPWLALSLLIASLAASAPSVARNYQVTVESRTDWRGLVGWMSASADQSTPVLITGQGVADAYGYYRRTANPIVVEDDAGSIEPAITWISTAGAAGVFLLPYWQGPADTAALDVLSERGFPSERRWFRNQRAQYFGLRAATDRASIQRNVSWGSLTLIEASVNPAVVVPGDIVRVGLVWANKGADPIPDLKVSIRLIDGTNDKRAQLDRFPKNDTARFNALRAAETLTDNYGIGVPPIPNGVYRVAVLVYEPETGRAISPTRTSGVDSAETGDLAVLGDLVVTDT